MLQGIFKSKRLKWNIVWFAIRGLYITFPAQSQKILWYIADYVLYVYDIVVDAVGVQAMLWIKLLGIIVVVMIGLYFAWKWLREMLFRYRVETGKTIPIIADGIIQEVRVDYYDDGYRNKWRNYTPNYNRSCRVQRVVPWFGEAKEDVFSFNLLQTKIPQQPVDATWNIVVDILGSTPEESALKFIQQYVKLWSKIPVIINPNNIDLYYTDDPLLQYNLIDQKDKQDTVNPKIVSWIIKRFVIPIAILIPVIIVILLLISTQL